MTLHRLLALLEACASATPPFPPTLLYDEGWLLRLVLDWLAGHPLPGHPLGFPEGGRWFSEGLLPTAFAARFRGDPLAEAHTHADGAVGHLAVGVQARADLALLPGATHLVVLEAKMMSPLSSGVAKAPYFDQGARSVACMAEVLHRAGRRPADLSRLGFYVLAPRSQVERGVFRRAMERGAIRGKVERRVRGYRGERDDWLRESFEPALERMELGVMAWKEVLGAIGAQDAEAAGELEGFYRRCLEYNGRA